MVVVQKSELVVENSCDAFELTPTIRVRMLAYPFTIMNINIVQPKNIR